MTRETLRVLVLFVFGMLSFAFADAQTVSGKITSQTGEPQPFATVQVKGTQTITTADAQGNYSIKAKQGDVLVFTSTSFEAKEVTVEGSVMNVTVNAIVNALKEVIVTGYTARSKRSNIGSASTVVIDDIRTQPIASFDQILQGQAPGLNVKTGSGQPGRNADVIIRGRTSVNGSVEPLYIVDGVEVRPGDFSTMNQGDFESVTVLKDAASTAIYGSRAANGVIVVTTKKGKSGKVRFAYDGQFGISMLPENKLKLMNTQEKLDFEMNIAGNPWGWSAADVTALSQINTNWNDFVFQDGKMQSHQLSASGGTDKTTFYTSFSYFDQEGVTINTGLKRYNGRLNLSHSERNVKFGVNLAGGWSNFRGTFEGDQSVGSPLNTVLWALPYEKAYNDDGTYAGSVQFPFWLNPVEELKENGDNSWQLKSTGNVFLEYKLPWIKNLTYRFNAGGDYSQFEGFSITKKGTQAAEQNGAIGSGLSVDGSVGRSLDRRFRSTITNSLTHKASFGANGEHELTTSVYTEYIRRRGRSFNYTGFGLLLPFDNEAGLVAGTAANGYIPIVGGGFPENSSLLSYFGTADYAFKNRYFVTLSGRTDGSSRLSPKNRWTQYGSIGAGWLISDESFFKVDAINYLKLRASFGAVGNQNGIGEFPYIQQYGRGTYGGQGTLNISRLGNADLTWEKRRTANVAVEVELLKSRIKTTVEYYNSLTTGLYFEPTVPATSGGNRTILANNGSMENQGIEVSLSFRIIDAKSFKWNVDANYAYNKNTIKSLPDNQDFQLYKSFQALQVGKPLNSFYLVQYAGVNPANGNSQYLKADGKTITEDYDANDLTVLGTSDAPHNAGFTNTFNFKGLELSAFFVYSAGNYVYNNARFNVEYYQYTTSGFARSGLTAWTTPGQITNFPRIDEATQGQTTRFLEKGDFLRLRNVMLSYSLPKSITQKLKIQGLRVFAQGQNLYTWHKFQGWDPEVSSVVDADGANASVSGAQYPALRSVNFGLNLNF
ncbi:TonB-linked SusC/RagA family outer membrane protein [Lacibacter cauensis]|uniref:TonB-linked SusC/RagA family outer membrane protein n=1 Tax=Lacibacter cauensis TaxID=510947 RepID=A0A562SHA4_9BACT|nr:TonB-dependent receptor [Lacibacter cauensis]TWI80657.1 TonB-linked SusC/RagA family outer membrane protein [Lacibacter cauensis]